MGSMAWSGFRALESFAEATDAAGIRFADALAEQLAAEADLPRRPFVHQPGGVRPHAYVEAHIEQGPRLEEEGLEIGVVTGIQGSRWFSVTLTGESAHAGATPRRLRRDAMQDFVRAMAALNALMADDTDTLRFTVGKLAVEPNSSNSVAGRVTFSIDLRHPDARVLAVRGDAVAGVVQAAVRETEAVVTEVFSAQPAVFDPLVIDAVAQAAAGLGLGHVRMPSGAFHDAQFMVPISPSGMVFVPCRKGISHNPAEYAEPHHCAAGTRVLTQALLTLAG
jgi:N-carbamoyl-L-amino-acid hydrolase